MYLDLTSNH